MLNVILETCAGTLTQGLIYAILSYGIFITYKILDFPDLTVDGTMATGGAAFIIPFMFVYQPALLLQGNTPDVAVACVTAVIGVIGLAMGMQGWMLTNCAPWERVLLIVGGLTLIYPGSMTDALGIALIVLAGISQAAKRKAQRSEV